MGKGFMYILECADSTYYTGSTKDLERRIAEHQGHLDTMTSSSLDAHKTNQMAQSSLDPLKTNKMTSTSPNKSKVNNITSQSLDDQGANYTKKRRPVKLVYYEEYERIDEAFYREKQIQDWSHKKKSALIEGKNELLPKLAKKVFNKKVPS